MQLIPCVREVKPSIAASLPYTRSETLEPIPTLHTSEPPSKPRQAQIVRQIRLAAWNLLVRIAWNQRVTDIFLLVSSRYGVPNAIGRCWHKQLIDVPAPLQSHEQRATQPNLLGGLRKLWIEVAVKVGSNSGANKTSKRSPSACSIT